MKAFKDILFGIAMVIVGFLSQIAGSAFVSLIYSFYLSISMISSGMAGAADQLQSQVNAFIQTPDFLLIASAAGIAVSAIVFFLMYYFMFARKTESTVKQALSAGNVAIIVAGGFLCQVAISMVLTMILPLFPDTMESYGELMESLMGGNIFISMFMTVILAPIAEECCFRGLILNKLSGSMPIIVANLVQALLFGIYHMNIVQGIYAFILGMVFGYVMIKTKSIFASILLHAVTNASAQVLDYIFPDAVFESYLLMCGFAIIAGIILIFIMTKIKPVDTPKVLPKFMPLEPSQLDYQQYCQQQYYQQQYYQQQQFQQQQFNPYYNQQYDQQQQQFNQQPQQVNQQPLETKPIVEDDTNKPGI